MSINQYDWKGYTDRERIFCYEYVASKTKNKAEAARNAGYSEKTAQQQATKVYKKCEARINEMIGEITSPLLVTADRIIQELAKSAFVSAKDFFDDEGRPVPIQNLSEDAAACIAGMKVRQEYGGDEENDAIITEYKLVDKIDSLRLLGQNLQMFTKRLVVDDKRPVVVVKDMTGRKKKEK